MQDRFSWVWHEASTFAPYHAEAVYEMPVPGQSADIAARGIGFVLRSLTPNHRDILRMLAEHQAADSSSPGLSFDHFYNKCREQMLVTTDAALRNHLTEMRDHLLVHERRGTDGKEYLYVQQPAMCLQELDKF